ncbi:hypothetical protein KAX75_07050 [candidate division WOR-3 bacterium]|nr:hypothetical protein [candidate division WOR-3 bacterium]
MKEIIFILLLFFSLLIPNNAQTENESAIIIENHHIVLEISDGELIVKNVLLLNITMIKNIEEPISFSIPIESYDFEILSGLNPDSLIKEKDRIIDTRKIKEGKNQIAFRYRIKIKGNKYLFPLDIIYDTQNFFLLVKNLELVLISEQLIDEGLLEMGERKYHAFSQTGFKKGEKVEINIHGLKKQRIRKKVLIISLIGIFLLIIVAILVIRKGKTDMRVISKSDILQEKKKALVAILATLDEKFEKGEIGEEVYTELRDENKEKLTKVLLHIERDLNDSTES